MSGYIAVFRAEIKRYYTIQWSHLGDSISWFLYAFLVFIAAIVILNGISGGEYGQEEQLLMLVGWLTWVVASDCMSELPHIISEETQTGTLEQISLLPIPLIGILTARSLAYFLGTGVKGIVAVAIVLVFIPTQSQSNGLDLSVIFLISLLGAYGLGFLFAGLAIIYKRTESITNLVFSLMIFLTGSLVGLEGLGSIFDVLKFLFPLTWGISLMRGLIADNNSLFDLISTGELLGFSLHSFIYLITGFILFTWGYRIARIKGNLAHY